MSKSLRHLFMVIGLAVMCLVIAACGQSGSQPAKSDSSGVVKLKIADTYPPTAVNYKVMKEIFIPALERSGKIKVEYYPGGEIAKAEDMLELVQDGTVDIAYVSPGFVAGALPLSSVISLPMEFGSDNKVASDIVWELVKRDPLKGEFEKRGVKPVYLSMNPCSEIFMKDKPVALPKDIKGMTIRGGGGDANETLVLMGASVVGIATNDLYESLQKGTISGMSYNFGSLLPYSLEEVTKFATDGADLGSLVAIYLMNLKRWNSLPPDIQEIIRQAGDLAVKEQAARYAAEVEAGKAGFQKKGGVIHKLTDQEKQEWKSAVSVAKDQWIKKMEGRGFKQAKQAYDELQAVKKQLGAK